MAVSVNTQTPQSYNTLKAMGIETFSNFLSDYAADGLFGDSEVGRNVGTIFSSGVSSIGNTIGNNLIKGYGLTQGMDINLGQSLTGAVTGIGANYIGQGINALGGDTRLSRGIGQGVATGLVNAGSTIKNIKQLIQSGKDAKSAYDILKSTKSGKEFVDAANNYSKASTLSKAAKWNLAGIGGQVLGSALGAATGPSKEYGGKYGGITQGMDTAYDLVQAAGELCK